MILVPFTMIKSGFISFNNSIVFFEFTDETFIVLSLGVSAAFMPFAFMISSLLFLDVLPKNLPIISWNKICPTTVKIPNLFILLLINFLVFSLSSTMIFSMPNLLSNALKTIFEESPFPAKITIFLPFIFHLCCQTTHRVALEIILFI